MFHLDNTSGVPDMPEPKEPMSNTPRWFGEGVQQGGISWPGADWFNIVQAELLNLLKAADIKPDKSSFDQLSRAIPVLGDAGLRANLQDAEGAYISGYNGSTVGGELDSLQFSKNVPGIYYGAFFENGTNALNLVMSHDGLTFGDPVRLTTTSGQLLRARDPSLVFYKGKWLMATTSNTVDTVDLTIYTSSDLINWTANDIKLNGSFAICSNTVAWDSGTVPASLLWAGELFIDPPSGALKLTISILLGVDDTTGGRYFGTYISELADLDTLSFTVPKRLHVIEHDGSTDKFSRIDAVVEYDASHARYIQVAKRENYGILDVFSAPSIDGQYTYLSSITSLQSTGAASGYLLKSSIEAPSIYQLKNGSTWVISFDPNDTFDGIKYVTTTDFISFSVPQRLRMPNFRHGSVKRGHGHLSPGALKALTDAKNGISGYSPIKERPVNFIRITADCSIIPQSDTVYWADASYSVSLVTPSVVGSLDYPRNFYFCVRSNSRLVRLRVTGAVSGGNWDIGWGVSNNRIIEFFYESLNNVYRSEAIGNPSYTSTRLKVDAGSTNINPSSIVWAPQHGRTYTIVDSDGTITINALPNMPVGTFFNVVIQSGIGKFAGLILKAANDVNHMGMPSDWIYYGGASGFDGVLIRIEKGSDLWFASTRPK